MDGYYRPRWNWRRLDETAHLIMSALCVALIHHVVHVEGAGDQSHSPVGAGSGEEILPLISSCPRSFLYKLYSPNQNRKKRLWGSHG